MVVGSSLCLLRQFLNIATLFGPNSPTKKPKAWVSLEFQLHHIQTQVFVFRSIFQRPMYVHIYLFTSPLWTQVFVFVSISVIAKCMLWKSQFHIYLPILMYRFTSLEKLLFYMLYMYVVHQRVTSEEDIRSTSNPIKK